MGVVTSGPHPGAPRPLYGQYPGTAGLGPCMRGCDWSSGGRGDTDPVEDGRGLESSDLDIWSTSAFSRCDDLSPVACQQQYKLTFTFQQIKIPLGTRVTAILSTAGEISLTQMQKSGTKLTNSMVVSSNYYVSHLLIRRI